MEYYKQIVQHILVAHVLLLIACHSPEFVEINGDVRDQENSQPISDAKIYLTRYFDDGFGKWLKSYQTKCSYSETDRIGDFHLHNVIKSSRLATNLWTSHILVIRDGYVPFLKYMNEDPIEQKLSIRMSKIIDLKSGPVFKLVLDSLLRGAKSSDLHFNLESREFRDSLENVDITFNLDLSTRTPSQGVNIPNADGTFRKFLKIQMVGDAGIALIKSENFLCSAQTLNCRNREFKKELSFSELFNTPADVCICIKAKNGRLARFDIRHANQATITSAFENEQLIPGEKQDSMLLAAYGCFPK